MTLRKNVASQHVSFLLVSATDGSPVTGATVGTEITKDGADGTPGGSVSEVGNGRYDYAPSQADTNATHIQFLFTATGAIPVERIFYTIGQDPTQTTFQVNVASLTNGVISAATFAANALDAVWSTATRVLTAGTNIVLAKDTGVTGFNDLSAAQVNAEVDTGLADYDGPTHAELVSEINDVQADIAGLTIPTANQNADALLDRSDAIETSLTVRGALRLNTSALAGKLSGSATTAVFRNVGDTKDRITATVDSATGNRTAVTTDAT